MPKGRGRGRARIPEVQQPQVALQLTPPESSPRQISDDKSVSLPMAQRPSHCSSYRKTIRVVTNVFKLHCNSDNAYHYDVDIVPLDFKRKFSNTNGEMPPSGICHLIIFELLKIEKGLSSFGPVYDGKKNMFTSQRLPIPSDGQDFEQSVCINGKEKRYQIVIKPVRKARDKDNKISLTPLNDYVSGKLKVIPEEILLVFNAVMTYRKVTAKEFNIRNSFFSTEARNRIPLCEGCEMILGYSQTIKFSEKGLAVVVNVAAAAFHKSGPVLEVLQDLVRYPIEPRTVLRRYEITKIENKMKNLRIEVTHQKFNRKYMIHGLGDPANIQKFEYENKLITVETYFQTQYKKSLRFPNMPCLLHEKPSNKSGNKKPIKVYLPMEVCNILPNQRIKKPDGKVTAAMIKNAAIIPEKRRNRIQQDVKTIQSNSGDNMNKFCLKMELNPIETDAGLLEKPKMNYFRNQTVSPDARGTWNMIGEFAESATQADTRKKGYLVSFLQQDKFTNAKLQELVPWVCQIGRKCGLKLNLSLSQINDGATEDIIKRIKDLKDIDFIIFILSEENPSRYQEVKFFAETVYNIPTQCLSEELVLGKKLNNRVIENICLKLNTKLGGVNHTLSEWPLALYEEGVIVFGADVVHNVGSVCPSIAAVVAAIDHGLGKYAVSCRPQTNPQGSGRSQEIIINLKEMVIRLLKAYYQNNRRKPQKILFYRDGVSYGQFQHVLEQEIPMIKEAFKALDPSGSYKPPITFVIVQKRHSVRFYPKNPEEGIGRPKNVPAGSIVDRDIVDPVNYDFYLCSHEGIQGTSKPTHYTVIFDENKVKPDIVTQLTYYLTHTYARCNRSIAIPAPVKYADLLAYRANNYIQHLCKSAFYTRNDFDDDIPEEIKDFVKKIDRIGCNMFFV